MTAEIQSAPGADVQRAAADRALVWHAGAQHRADGARKEQRVRPPGGLLERQPEREAHARLRTAVRGHVVPRVGEGLHLRRATSCSSAMRGLRACLLRGLTRRFNLSAT